MVISLECFTPQAFFPIRGWAAKNVSECDPRCSRQSQAERLRSAAERVGLIYHELSEIVIRRPELLDQFFNLTPWQKAMWLASEGRWHGIARVDLFICPNGAEDGACHACEMNSDTPSGEAEAALLNQLLHPFHPEHDRSERRIR